MRLRLALAVALMVTLSFAATPDYTITILKPDPLAAIPRPEYQPSTNFVGKSISAIFGELLEVRVELEGVNIIGIEGDTKKVSREFGSGLTARNVLVVTRRLPGTKRRGYVAISCLGTAGFFLLRSC